MRGVMFLLLPAKASLTQSRRVAAASASIAFNRHLVSSLGCVNTGFREDITFSTGRLQAASDGLAMILGLAVGGL